MAAKYSGLKCLFEAGKLTICRQHRKDAKDGGLSAGQEKLLEVEY